MTTWIGQPGSMRPTPCVTTMPVGHDDATIFGGGPGTLSPPRVLYTTDIGGAPRRWAASIDISDMHELASVTGLAHAQRTLGTGWRVIPCDAVATNMFTPQASESLTGWNVTELAQRVEITQPGYEMEFLTVRRRAPEGFTSVLEDGVVLRAGVVLGPASEGEWYEVVEEVERVVYPSLGFFHSDRVITPTVPVIGEGARTIHAAVFHTGSATLRLQGISHSGAVNWTRDFTADNGTRLVRTQAAVTFPDIGSPNIRFAVIPTTGRVLTCWPSIQFGPSPYRYTPGGGCDEAWVTPPTHNTVLTDGQHLTTWDYTITETGA